MPVAEVLERVSDVISGLDATAYQRDGSYTDAWSEALFPFSAEESADSTAHLDYVVLAGRTLATGQTRDSEHGEIQLMTPVEVQFAFYLRHDQQVADFRLATRAAGDVVRAVARESNWGTADINVEVDVRFEARIIPDESWIIVVTSFRILHEELL